MSYPTEREVIRDLIESSNIAYDRGYDAGRKDVLDEILLKITHLRSKVYLNAQDQIIVEVLTIINNKIRELSV